MSILKLKARQRVPFPATTSMAFALPLAVSLPATAVVFGDRFANSATAALTCAGLALIACTAGLSARAAACDAEQVRRDEEVLDALEPLAGLRR
ncbi:hypothetical protein ACIQU4_36085 [Streptomyces sp. NPDC090741]|uniref:hypothetical protein n=1 Tax=Streptomyces sp. NPDC090741 TaxID=3365967 RepID=UPI00380B1226